MENDKIFGKREALQYLLEDNELALIELNSKLSLQFRLLSFLINSKTFAVEIEPSYLAEYLYRKLSLKSLIEWEIVREKSNRNYLQAKAAKLWEQ